MNQSAVSAKTACKPRLFQRKGEVHIPGEAGVWIFVLGDITLYVGLFLSFMTDRMKNVELFNQSAVTLHPTIGLINMILLLTSSLAVVLGVRAVREKIAEKLAPTLFAAAFLCGAGFVVNKYFEYSDLVSMGFVPFKNLFYVWYYILTGLHLTHLLGGMCILVFLFNVSRKRPREEGDARLLESGASFWHAVDLLWVILFPLLYLMR